MATTSKPPKFRQRDRHALIVCRDAGVPHPANDLDDDRTYRECETVDLRLDAALPVQHPDSLRAQVVANGERIIVRALHAVFAKGGGKLVETGDVFDVDRACVFVVWR